MKTLKLLLVEDDSDVREVLEIALNLDSSIRVTCHGSAEDALADLREKPRSFDVALLDYRLPGMTGIELHQELRRFSGMVDLPTVIITAEQSAEYIALFKSRGIAGLIAKPFDPLTLAKDVRALADPHRSNSKLLKWLGR